MDTLIKKIRDYDLRTIKIVLTFLLCLQIVFWYKTEQIKPKLGLLPKVPNQFLIKALAFGDEEFYFRAQAYKIQNAGDTFGRFSALKNYNYDKLYRWFTLLDTLDNQSDYVPSLAAYYYSQTQHKPDTRYIINYLEKHADYNPAEKWWWYYQALSISNYILDDQDIALKIAYKLKNIEGDIPLGARQMVAIIHKARGEDCEAIRIITEILADYEKKEGDRKITDRQLDGMKFFIDRRIKSLKQKNFNPEKCFK